MQNGMFQSHVKAFQEGLYIDALRGEDGTGICLIDKDGSADVVKENIESGWFLQHSDVQKLLNRASQDGKALLGHNRKATVGASKAENSHPFVVDDEFVFFHNGSLFNWRKLGYDTEVDSEALGKHIHKTIREDKPLGEALGEVDGAYACVWYDLVKEEIAIVRNNQRPMYIVEVDNGWFYGSELEMIRLVCARNTQKIKAEAELPIDTLCRWRLTDSFSEIKPILTKLDVKKPTPTRTKGTTGGTNTKRPGTQATTKGGSKLSKSAFKRWLKSECLQEPCSFWVEDVSPLKGLSTGPMCELSGTIDVMNEDGVELNVQCSAFISGSYAEVREKYADRLVQGVVSAGNYYSQDYLELTLSNVKVVHENPICH